MTATLLLLTALLIIPFIATTTTNAQDPLCGTKGHFCAENFTLQVRASSSCGKYSGVFSEPNVTMSQNDVPLANYTYTNTSEMVDSTVYLSEILQGKAYELYSEQQALVDAAQSCESVSGSLKTEFPSIRLNNSQCSINVSDVLSEIKPILEVKWLAIQYGRSIHHPAKSCQDLFEHDPTIPSGMYWLEGTGGGRVERYCDMDGNNCDGMGGWMRIYKLDLEGTDTDFHSCPNSAFEQHTPGINKLLCRRAGTVTGCTSATFSAHGRTYNKVCGKATGYQRGTTDAFYRAGGAQNRKIDDNYVDGISITHGSNPRNHIFTFAAGCSESGSCWVQSRCPCQTGENPPIPTFLGHDDFYCEAASYWHPQGGTWYSEPIWDGEECLWKEAPCCSVSSNIPWFYKTLSFPTTNAVEVRVCTDEASNGEDVGFSQLELYVK